MSHQDSDEISAAFLDVSAYFSQEEWKLLHEWQKELYRNVMKEIHQALISLGPLIATTVFSLRAKEKEGICPMEYQDSERRNSLNVFPSENIANHELSFRINRDESLHLKHPQNSEGRESNECHSTGFPFLNTETCLRKEKKPVSMFIDHLGLEVGESSINPNSGNGVVSFRLKDEEKPSCMDHHDSERIETISNPRGHEVVSFRLKNEEEAFCMGDHDSERRESISSPSGDGTINRKEKVFDSVKHTEKETPCKATSRKAKVKVAHSYEKGAHSRSQLWSGMNQELTEEEAAHRESVFSDPAHFSFQQGMANVERSEPYNDCGSTLNLARLLACQPNQQNTLGGYSCTECEKTFSTKELLVEHKRTHVGVRPYQCIECEKSFSRKDNLFIHMRTHTGERPYQCVICGKSFSQHGVLNRHQRTHVCANITQYRDANGGRDTLSMCPMREMLQSNQNSCYKTENALQD